MSQLHYGVWDGKVYDFRNGQTPAEGELPRLTGFDGFDENNPVQAFIANRGFVVFDGKLSLVEAFRQYLAKAADESCGKCTPCRVGTCELRDRLALMVAGQGRAEWLDGMKDLANQLSITSLCGLGKTCARALEQAITHFRDVFEAEIAAPKTVSQHGEVYATAPCIEACPAKLDVPQYVDHIKDGKPELALGVILDKYPLASSCGRVCVRLCELACRRKETDGAVGIKMLKRFVGDAFQSEGKSLYSTDLVQPLPGAANKRVAVVGAGPAGINCAYHLLRNGFQVDVFEAHPAAGGMASVGIPSYRLPKNVLKAETEDAVVKLGGRMHFGKKLGQDFTVNDLEAQGYDGIFLGFGCSKGSLLGVENEDPTLEGYASGIDFLLKVHKHVEYGEPFSMDGEVVVVGGGNVAMDCIRSARRMGAKKVHLVYRRTEADMPADHEEIIAAHHEGIEFHCLTNPSKLVTENGRVVGVEVLQMRQTEPDAKGRRNVEAVPGTEHVIACSHVIAAIGQSIDRDTLKPEDNIATDRWGCIAANPETLETSRRGVFAGGDCVLGALTLIHAMDQGARAARSMAEYLTQGQATVKPEQRIQKLLADNKLLTGECIKVPHMPAARTPVPELEAEERVNNFEEVEQVISAEAAYHEADRCLRCYRLYSVVTEAPFGQKAAEKQPEFAA